MCVLLGAVRNLCWTVANELFESTCMQKQCVLKSGNKNIYFADYISVYWNGRTIRMSNVMAQQKEENVPICFVSHIEAERKKNKGVN